MSFVAAKNTEFSLADGVIHCKTFKVITVNVIMLRS